MTNRVIALVATLVVLVFAVFAYIAYHDPRTDGMQDDDFKENPVTRNNATPPVAERRPHRFTLHGVTIEDPYHWLKDDGYPDVQDADVLAYLNAENEYFHSVMGPHEGLVDRLFQEIKSHIKEDDESVPVREGDYFYQWRFAKGAQYRLWLRWPVAQGDAPPEDAAVILDEPKLAEGHEYFRLGALAVGRTGRYLAYSTDTSGAERFLLQAFDLEQNAMLDDAIDNTIGGPVWSADDRYFFYVVVDEKWRPYRVLRHELGTPVEDDVLVYEEADPGFFVGISATSDHRFVVIGSGDHVTSEAHLIPTDDPLAAPVLVSARRTGHEYTVDHQEDRFVIKTNDKHKNARLVTAPSDDPSEQGWVSLIEGDDRHYLQGFRTFARYVVLEQRVDGQDRIVIIDRDGGDHTIDFDEPVYSVGIGANEEFDTDVVRLGFSSMVTPPTVHDYDMAAKTLTTRKVQEVPGGYEPGDYRSRRLSIPSRDGKAIIPVSMVYRHDTPLTGTAPVYLYGYGAYGYAIPPAFSASRIPLLDLGFVFAIAHIRGGDDLGYHWYEDGKLDRRTNTFNDFVDVARGLVEEGIARPGRIAISGASAGGELMGAVINQAPELWGAAVLNVPFVDVLNTMLDTSLPLTPMEWPEWGNPIKDAEAFANILSYSPYDQLVAGEYPPMMVTAGLNDPRVTYWEPAKYVAKLRTLKTGDSELVLKTNMGAGHGGVSGRFDSLREVAEEYAFIALMLGIAQ